MIMMINNQIEYNKKKQKRKLYNYQKFLKYLRKYLFCSGNRIL